MITDFVGEIPIHPAWESEEKMVRELVQSWANVECWLFNSVWGMFFQRLPIAVCVFLVHIVVKYKKDKICWNDVVRAVFAGYIAEVVALVLTPIHFWDYLWSMIIYGWYDPGAGHSRALGSFNFIPILYKVFAGDITVGTWVRNMLGWNMLMFVPFGFLFPLLDYERPNLLQNTIKYVLLFICAIEVAQPFMGRSFDIDDIICNFTGALIGYGLFVIVERIVCGINKKDDEARKCKR